MKENVGFIKNWCYDNEKKIFVLFWKLFKFKKRINNSNEFMFDLFLLFYLDIDLNLI